MDEFHPVASMEPFWEAEEAILSTMTDDERKAYEAKRPRAEKRERRMRRRAAIVKRRAPPRVCKFRGDYWRSSK